MTLSERISWVALGTCMSLWAFVMVVLGLTMILDWPNRLGFPLRWCVLGGGLLVASGQFVFALTASRLFFPGASPRLTGVVELLPWAMFAVVAAGVLLWNT